MELLFQIDSVSSTYLMIGDAGVAYVFYDAEEKRIEFCIQCC